MADLSRTRSDDERLFLTDDKIRQGIELLFFAYRDFTGEADTILARRGLGRAHHRALYFIGQIPAISITELASTLGISKQSLNRVLRDLMQRGLVSRKVGAGDRRQRLLILTTEGAALESRLFQAQRERVHRAYFRSGAEAVAGFRAVLENFLAPPSRARIGALRAGRR